MNTNIINPPRIEWPDLVKRPVIDSKNLDDAVLAIINSVRQYGDQSVTNYAIQFQGFAPENLWVREDEIAKAGKRINKDLKKAILTAKKNI